MEEKTTEQKKVVRVGRPRIFDGLVNMHISLTLEQRDWLEGQKVSISHTIRTLIDRAMKKDKKT